MFTIMVLQALHQEQTSLAFCLGLIPAMRNKYFHFQGHFPEPMGKKTLCVNSAVNKKASGILFCRQPPGAFTPCGVHATYRYRVQHCKSTNKAKANLLGMQAQKKERKTQTRT